MSISSSGSGSLGLGASFFLGYYFLGASLGASLAAVLAAVGAEVAEVAGPALPMRFCPSAMSW